MVRLYKIPVTKGKSFKGARKHVMPNQSMSLREIVQRFVRRESLPISKEGLYEERFGDLEKLKNKDITEQMDKVEELKTQIDGFTKRQKKRAQEAADAAKKDSTPSTTNSPTKSPEGGGEPVKSPTT